MVKLNKIYTRSGDDGTTGLGTGERRAKYDLRVAAFGTVDEVNACIGMARVHTRDNAEIDTILAGVQNDLFDLGADLAAPDKGEDLPYESLRIVHKQVERLETDIDRVNAHLDTLQSFVLPGGSPAAAALHLARTVARRAERVMVELATIPQEPVSEEAIRYINRLSDLLFVAARAVNDGGRNDILWVPGQNR